MTARCIHCRIESEDVTRDHVFPAAWYTDNTPSNVQRWTVPSCRECNGHFGALEMDLLVRMVPCIDPQKPGVSGLKEKVYEAFGIGMEGKIDQDEFQKRKNLAVKVFRELKPYNDKMSYFPNFGPHKGFPPETQHAINMPVGSLISVLEKIFRGAEYKLGKKRIVEYPYRLNVYHREETIPELEALLSQVGKTSYLGPGFKLERVASTEQEVLYKALIWDTWIAYGSINLISRNNFLRPLLYMKKRIMLYFSRHEQTLQRRRSEL